MDTNALHITCSNCQCNNVKPYTKAVDVEYFTSEQVYQYYNCICCDVLFIHPQPTNDLKKIYPSNYYSFNDEPKSISFKIKNRLDRFYLKKKLNKLPQKELHVLDVGGGNGRLCDIIIKADNRVVHTQIVDIDESAEKTALQKGHRYFCGLMENFNSTQQYDVILMLNLIEHVADPKAVLQKAKQLLSPGGIIILQTPNFKSLDARLFKDSNWGGYHCPRHWVIFNKKSFLSLAGKCGLEPQHFSYTQGAAFWTVSILHKMQQLKIIKAGASRPLVYHPAFGMISMITALFDFIRKPFAPLSQMQIVLKHAEKMHS